MRRKKKGVLENEKVFLGKQEYIGQSGEMGNRLKNLNHFVSFPI